MLGRRFATRINSFASNASEYWPTLTGKPSLIQMVQRAATVDGLTELDLNYPDHIGDNPVETARAVRDCGLAISGLAMRYYTNPGFKRGAFTNPDATVRREQSVKLDHLPLLLRVPSIPPDLLPGQRLRLAVESIDLLAPEITCRFLNLLGESDAAEVAEEAEEGEGA